MVSVNRYNIQHVIFDGNYVSDVQLDNQSIWSTSLVPKFYTWEKPYLRNLFSPVDDNDAETTITRDGLSYHVFLNSFASASQVNTLNASPIRPTYNLTGSNVNLVTNRGIGTNYNFDSWYHHWYYGGSVYDDNIMIYNKPYVGDVSMTINALTTPNQFYPSNLSSTITLAQPSVWASIGVTDTTSSTVEAQGYNSISPFWSNNGAFYVKIILYKFDWDSISDMSISWSITGGKYDQFSPNSGTITSFRQMVASGYSNYAVGYAPIQYSAGDNLDYEDTNFNVVANGLKFRSFTNPKVIAAGG